jgi:hypothetical protein
VSKALSVLLFFLAGALCIALGFLAYGADHQMLAAVAVSLGATIVAVVVVNYLWAQVGGDPLLHAVHEMREATAIVGDALGTGLRRVYTNRRQVNYDEEHRLIEVAKEVFFLSLVFQIRPNDDLKRSLLTCVRRGGHVRILVSDPDTGIDVDDEYPSALRVRQYAEDDTEEDRMRTSIHDTLRYLTALKADLAEEGGDVAERFEFRVLARLTIYCQLTGIDDRLQVAHYCNKRRGVDSPTFVLEKAGDRSLYAVYREEFEYLWKKAAETTSPVAT